MKTEALAGKLDGGSLQNWFHSDAFQEWLKGLVNPHVLIEYVHEFVFSGLPSLVKDIKNNNIAQYSLRGRLFWAEGQIEWRRLGPDTYSLVMISDNQLQVSLPAGLKEALPLKDAIASTRDRSMILWGTRDQDGVFLELRVAGSKPIDYPEAITKGSGGYPVIMAKEYLDEADKAVLWRFVAPGSKNAHDLDC